MHHPYDSTIPSENAYKVHLLLAPVGEQTKLDTLVVNPNRRIPALRLGDDTVLAESNAEKSSIARYAYTKSAARMRFHVGPVVEAWLCRVASGLGHVAIKLDPMEK
ncbi:hypothetical protein BDY21DRAFT_418420 [Lineolata rhizophorae]|uniref:Uncharacterized protein n=1 Tax=Lineolata rhizophorae TaxID=578093 RepID=A0A6A6PBL8_9PEZI|nr:hypothetical protein BDY21DRAFT_418420 [Lineolata rhizophorae]